MKKKENSILKKSFEEKLSEVEASTENVSLEWNDALERVYEAFMYDLKKSTINMTSLSEWLISNSGAHPNTTLKPGQL